MVLSYLSLTEICQMRSQKSYFSEIHFGLDFLLYMFLKPELLQFIVIKPELT
jgi:hypothetical protein